MMTGFFFWLKQYPPRILISTSDFSKWIDYRAAVTHAIYTFPTRNRAIGYIWGKSCTWDMISQVYYFSTYPWKLPYLQFTLFKFSNRLRQQDALSNSWVVITDCVHNAKVTWKHLLCCVSDVWVSGMMVAVYALLRVMLLKMKESSLQQENCKFQVQSKTYATIWAHLIKGITLSGSCDLNFKHGSSRGYGWPPVRFKRER